MIHNNNILVLPLLINSPNSTVVKTATALNSLIKNQEQH
jgi:hypothetical protein